MARLCGAELHSAGIFGSEHEFNRKSSEGIAINKGKMREWVWKSTDCAELCCVIETEGVEGWSNKRKATGQKADKKKMNIIKEQRNGTMPRYWRWQIHSIQAINFRGCNCGGSYVGWK